MHAKGNQIRINFSAKFALLCPFVVALRQGYRFGIMFAPNLLLRNTPNQSSNCMLHDYSTHPTVSGAKNGRPSKIRRSETPVMAAAVAVTVIQEV